MMIMNSLEEGESISWEGKPAPRCYTYRHWRHSIFGVIFLAICFYWQLLGIDMAKEYDLAWLNWLPTPFLLIGLYFSVGHLLQARLEWNNVSYVITNKRLIMTRGLVSPVLQSLELDTITYLNLESQGEELGTLKVCSGETDRLVLHCIEHPQQAVSLLEQSIKKNQEIPQVNSEE